MNWTPTTQELPPENVVVETQNSVGDITVLVRQGNLWFFEDLSMYVYYVPKAWRFRA